MSAAVRAPLWYPWRGSALHDAKTAGGACPTARSSYCRFTWSAPRLCACWTLWHSPTRPRSNGQVQDSDETSLLSCILLEGKCRNSNRAMAAHMARYAGFPYIKVATSDDMVGFSEQVNDRIAAQHAPWATIKAKVGLLALAAHAPRPAATAPGTTLPRSRLNAHRTVAGACAFPRTAGHHLLLP